MAGRLTFHYFQGNSPLHRWDARCKLPALFCLTFGMLHARPEPLVLFTVLLGAAFASTRAPLKSILSDMRAWGVFLVIIFLIQAVSPGDQEGWPYPWMPCTPESLSAAALTCWRLGLLLLYSVLFTMVTRPREMQDALLWFMKPLPFLPARRIALMFSLLMRFLPLLLDEVESVRTAAKSRLGHLRRNPLTRIKYLVLPVFRRSILRADELALALAARGFNEDLPVSLPGVRFSHVFPLLIMVMVVLIGSTPIVHAFSEDLGTLLDLLVKRVE